MTGSTITHPETARVHLVDCLRGFALAGIVLVHNLEHFNFFAPADLNPPGLAWFDSWMWTIVFFLFSGKAYAIFSMLFGFSFWVQYSRRQAQGYDYTGRFCWRMLLLVGFGVFHGLFYSGDILMVYALLSIALVITRNWSDKAVFIAAICLLLQPLELYRIAMTLASTTYESSHKFFALAQPVADAQVSAPFAQMVWINFSWGQLSNLVWNFEYGRVCQAPGLFLLGMLAARRKIFSQICPQCWKTTLWISLVLAVVFFYLNKMVIPQLGDARLKPLVEVLVSMYGNLPVMLCLLSLLILAWHYTAAGKKILSLFGPYGRMSLTNYIGQSILGTTLYMGYGFALYHYCGGTLSVLIGVMILSTQICLSHWWLKRYEQGPLEYLWKRGTWLGYQQKPGTVVMKLD